MIILTANKPVQRLDNLIVPAFEKRKCKTIQSKKDITPHDNRLYNSDLSYSNTRQGYLHLPYSQFRSRLISYLSQSYSRLQTTIEPEQLGRNISQELDTKKQNSNSCKQTKVVFHKRNLKKKNIKQYISEVALAKRKKNQVKIEVQHKEVGSSMSNKSKKRPVSLILSSSQSQVADKLIPIHHTQTHFYEKDNIRKLSHLCLRQKTQKLLKGQEEAKQKDFPSDYRQKQLVQSRIEIILQTEVEDSFRGRFQENKRLNLKSPNSCPKRTTFMRRKNLNRKNQQELEQISPWKRRNTIDLQPLLSKNNDVYIS